jgi:hypothetical protein
MIDHIDGPIVRDEQVPEVAIRVADELVENSHDPRLLVPLACFGNGNFISHTR